MIQDGLVLALDASDRNSYASGSTTWFDLSGNNSNTSLVNSPIFDSGSTNAIVFDGVNDYAYINSQSKILTPTFTICSTVNPLNFTNAVIFTRETARLNLGISYGVSNGAYFFIRGSNYPTAELNGVYQTYPFQLNTWYHVTFIVDIPGNNYKMYVNGSQIWSSNIALGTDFQNPGVEGVIASRYGGAAANANIKLGSFHFYNRVLSATEILQNYNAIKTRFGLK